jgi:two-component sensor histidine kinase
MSRPWHIWTAFGLCLAVVLGAMGWLSITVLRLDRAQTQAKQRAAFEENVRLALWRMDSALSGTIAAENARPYFAYSSFYPAQRAYNKMFVRLDQGEVLVPSPLLTQTSPYILLHFQFSPSGKLSSPQVPEGNMLDLAEARFTTYDRIKVRADRLRELQGNLTRDALLAQLRVTGYRLQEKLDTRYAEPASNQKQRSSQEWQARLLSNTQQVAARKKMVRPPLSSDLNEGLMRPVWVADTLLLTRRVSVSKQDYIQGCWFDWLALKNYLLFGIKDLLPDANLEPVKSELALSPSRMLAGLPVRLVTGKASLTPAATTSPVLWSLAIAWGCVLLGAGAVAVLLSGTVSLSERRWAFVSAVTHELRTPLTTFRMYAEMLAEGMVPTEEKRERYLRRLCTEADRLAHLVENVLAYARLERGSIQRRVQPIALKELLETLTGRLSEHARQAGMELTVDAESDVLSAKVRVDTSAVEQILFNLIDNACKYAASASEMQIHIDARLRNGTALLKVRDHGPGISEADRRHLFRPFRKSAREAAGSAPGVGLGLALSRRLAREMGADLYLDKTVKDGACFVLALPLG